ncbi:hypothetical protein Tco_0992588 [Tanacetum coccineum]|uniref:Uncharacterized protein n=1 Tax=Tanacetum coccineum TaxID=301880 RepID=A0ABQ5F3C2_9ASTR
MSSSSDSNRRRTNKTSQVEQHRTTPIGLSSKSHSHLDKFFFNRDLDYLRFGSKGDRIALSITKMKAAYYPDVGLEQMVPDQMWIEAECMYDISATYGISHWWFRRQKFYIDRHSAETNRRAIVRTHMRILSVVSIDVFSIYGYDYMKQIVLRRADNQEYTIAENDFKDLYPSDFEDLYLLNLQGHLNHLPPRDRKILSSAVNLWIRNLVIRQRVEDFQLGIESYQTQLNLTKPRWEATGLEFMHDYKILDSQELYCLETRESSETWKALLVEEYAKETTDFYGEPNDDILFVASRPSCVSYKDGKVRYSIPRSRQSWRDLPRDNLLVSVEVLRASKSIIYGNLSVSLETTIDTLSETYVVLRGRDRKMVEAEAARLVLTGPWLTKSYLEMILDSQDLVNRDDDISQPWT